uniref:Uncharacterized protein n=1 Tax=Arundo donax TaxID=35708 RepID=A0A0A9D9L2_ARUDO
MSPKHIPSQSKFLFIGKVCWILDKSPCSITHPALLRMISHCSSIGNNCVVNPCLYIVYNVITAEY